MTRIGTAILLLGLLAGGAAAAPVTLGPHIKDESNGYKLRIPLKWEQVPTKFQEVAIVGKWGGRAKRGYYEPFCNVLRFVRAAKEGGAEESGLPGGFPVGGMPGYEGLLRFQPKDLWEYLGRNTVVGSWPPTPEPDFKMADKSLRADVRVFREAPRGGGAPRDVAQYSGLAIAAQIEKADGSGDAVFGVIFVCSQADEEQMANAFRQAIRSFKLLDLAEADTPEEGEDAVTDADIFVDSETKPEAWRAARKKKLIQGWDAVDTKNYLVVYNKEVKPLLVKTIAKHIEAIREQVYEKLFPPAREMKAISVVRVCKDPQEYARYGGPGGSAGYWSRGDEELVFYQDKSNEKDSLRVLYHEAFHQYIHYAVGDVAPHSWFNEGHGDYFAGFDYKDGKFVPNVFRWRTGIIADALATRSYVPLDQFLKYTQGQYYANPGLCYAQGWSFIYFLREVERRKLKQYQKYFGLLDKYFAAIKANVKDVRENGLEGLSTPPPPPPEVAGGDSSAPYSEPGDESAPAAPPGLVPGLEVPFPGEHAAAGAPKRLESAAGETETSAGPGKITSVQDALESGVDKAFEGIDLAQLEKDWIEFSK